MPIEEKRAFVSWIYSPLFFVRSSIDEKIRIDLFASIIASYNGE